MGGERRVTRGEDKEASGEGKNAGHVHMRLERGSESLQVCLLFRGGKDRGQILEGFVEIFPEIVDVRVSTLTSHKAKTSSFQAECELY